MKINKEKMGKGVKFERIRRITGYLVGSLDTWCNSKKAEERDRVKHGLSSDGIVFNYKDKEVEEYVEANPIEEE